MTETARASEPSRTATAPSRAGSAPAGFAVGLVAAVVGLLPWLIGGGRLPLQNLWATEVRPEDMPFALLPVNQYYAVTVFVLILMGGVFAGLAVHVVARSRRVSVWPAAVGLLLVHVVVVAQSFTVVARGLGLGVSADSRSVVYFTGMLGGAIVAVLLAQGGLWLISRRSAGPITLAIGLWAVPFGLWIGQALMTLCGSSGVPSFAIEMMRWLPALIVGVALVWCGVRPARRIAVWLVVLAAVWVTPALFTTVQYTLGIRATYGDLAEMMSVARPVFPSAMADQIPPALAALAIAVVGVIGRELSQHHSRARDAELASHP